MHKLGKAFLSATLLALLYLYIFQPPLFSKYIYLGVEIVVFIVFQCLYGFRPLKKFYYIFRLEINILLIVTIYAIFRDIISGEIVYSNRMAYFTFQAFLFSGLIIWFLKNKDIEQKLLYVGIIGSIVTVYMMINPQFNSIISNYMRDELINYENFEIRYRGYGFSENITFTYSYVLGICASICFLKTKNKILYVFPFVSCLIGVAFNARIGFIPIVVTLCYSIVVNKDVTQLLKLIFGIVLVSCCLLYFCEDQIEIYKETSWLWISSAFYELSDFLFGTSFQTNISTFDSLAGSFLILPDNITDWIFGSGKSLFNEREGNNSDIGYILQLNYGGILFLSLIVLFIIYTIFRYWKTNKLSWFTIIYIISVVLLNYKGFFFAGTPGARFIYLLYTWGIIKRKLKWKFSNFI